MTGSVHVAENMDIKNIRDACKKNAEKGAQYLILRYNNTLKEYRVIVIYSKQDASNEVIKALKDSSDEEYIVGVVSLFEDIDHQIYNMFRPTNLIISRVVN